jgi:DNA repair exonuclease SbcCD ATPase subunit
MGFFKKLQFWRRVVAAKPKGLQKQEEETAARQENSEDNFQCRITELEEEVRRLNIENKQLKDMLDGLTSASEEKVEERDCERVEIEATPALEKELKESSPEMEKVDVTLRGQPTEMEGVGTDVAAIANTPQRSCPLCDRPNLARRWEEEEIDSDLDNEEYKAREEEWERQKEERYKERMKNAERLCNLIRQLGEQRRKKRRREFELNFKFRMPF